MTILSPIPLLPNFYIDPLQAHHDDDGYPELGGVRSADFSLLKEDLEWELAFNFLLPYQELLTEVGARPGSLHRICHFVSMLTNVFSRYIRGNPLN